MKFKSEPVTGGLVERFEKYKTAAAVIEASKTKPVFVKYYEEWCGHCKKLKKHFQQSSKDAPDWTFLEVECSKSDAHQGFCGMGGVEGFPTLVIFKDGKKKKYEGGRTFADMTKYITIPPTPYPLSLARLVAPVARSCRTRPFSAAASHAPRCVVVCADLGECCRYAKELTDISDFVDPGTAPPPPPPEDPGAEPKEDEDVPPPPEDEPVEDGDGAKASQVKNI